MRIKLTPDFNEDDIQKEIEKFFSRVIAVTKNELDYLAFEIITDARNKTKAIGGFDDDSGNLWSSIGFILMYDGEVLHEDFKESNQGSDRATGVEVGRKMAGDIAKENPEGWAIVIVAGMNYASWVEAKGYDVISGSTLIPEARLAQVLKNIEKAFK